MTQPPDLPIWSGPVQLFWRTDVFGYKDRALFVGGLHVGGIMQWSGQDNPMAGQWRAWIMTDEDGRQVGWYRIEKEAKDALIDEVIKHLLV